ncbi:MAG: MBL fold metallo-hydrolase [Dehalococcoidia bacterium]
MEITWLGRTCFRLRGREGAVITDPCPPESGYKTGKLSGDVVTISRVGDPDYGYRDSVPAEARVLDAPGEFEVGGILVSGVAMKRPDGKRNVAFVFELDGIKVAHLGVPGPKPTSADLDGVKGVDILLLPVGGGGSVLAAAAQDIMTAVDPRIVIPMHYRTDQERLELDPLDSFLKETGANPEPQARITVTKSQLPAELTVMVLQPRSG